mgnify:CR=1 FL=1|tara:strand:+ start:1224 stop:2144 length:921 start_codon:yes stop_codon:yes gene_type:complete
MVELFHIPHVEVNTNNFDHILHDSIVNEVEQKIANYVGAKYAVGINSATNALFLSILNKNKTISLPTMIPPVVCNAIITSGNSISFNDNIEWVGDSYIFAEFEDYKIIDSAQKLEKDQFINECKNNDLMIFSFYPTKPLGGVDGSIIVSNDKVKIDKLRSLANNGMSQENNSWDRKQDQPGYKFYLPAINAAVINSNLDKYEDKLSKLKIVRDFYNRELCLNNTSNHLYRINVKNRDKLIKLFNENDISYGIHYHCQHQTSCFKEKIILDKSEKESKETISIPFHEKLSMDNLHHIVSLVKENAKV